MKEDQFKKIIKKSSLETSDDFINSLMITINEKKALRKKRFLKVFLSCVILILIITFTAFQLMSKNNTPFSFLASLPRLPIFIGVTLALLIYINSFVRLSEQQTKKLS